MQVAVLGGAFDPPHAGHTAIAHYLLESGKADVIWFLPVHIHAFGKSVTAPEHRLAMLKLVAEQAPDAFKVQTYELEQAGTNYTYQTLKYFQKTFPNYSFSFVIGADNLAKFPQWKEYQALCREFPILVYPRQGFTFEPLQTDMVPLLEAPEVTMSSTQIRQAVGAGESVTGLVEPKVAQYIKSHHLYVT